MSKYNQYARRADAVAREAFAEYGKAKEAYQKAKDFVKLHPKKSNYGENYEEAATVARAEADLLTARAALIQAEDNLKAKNREFDAIRDELEAELVSDYSAKPEDIDEKTLHLINSGILKPHEYKLLMNKAKQNGNNTMIRLIGKAAEDAADRLARMYPENTKPVEDMRVVAFSEPTPDGSTELARFDVLKEAFYRSTENTEMIPDWDDLTRKTVEEL